MSNFKAILFDMDGTLLPMDMEEFTSGYFKILYTNLTKYNIPYEKLVKTIWEGTATMVNNDGSRTNREIFWEKFGELIPEVPLKEIADTCDRFYRNDFDLAIKFTKQNPLAKEAVTLAHKKAPIVALATNPLFPYDGQITRMKWIGLKDNDFDLITAYETDSYCKPNPKYFYSVCDRLGVKPEECLMIGNDEKEDMYACKLAGIQGYLVTDTMIKSESHPWNGLKGSFEELVEFLNNL